MARRGYAVVFAIILLLAAIGGIFGARFLLQRLQNDFIARPSWTPPTVTVPGAAEGTPTGAPTATVAMVGTATIRPTEVVLVVATPEDVAPLPANTGTPSSPVSRETPGTGNFDITPTGTITTTETLTATGTLTPTLEASDLPFILARPVRNSVGDCPGSYVLGQVTDRAGNPLPDIRLKLEDEYGNVQYAISKPGPGDKGFYDFPVTGPPRRFTLAIVDAADQPLSAEVRVEHQVGDDPDATCHRADWQRR